MANSYFSHLECASGCGAGPFDPRESHFLCPSCRLPLLARYDLQAARGWTRESLAGREPNMWRYRELMPLLPGDEPVTLLTTSPHAHRMANHMKFTLERADGEKIVMHDQSFNFEEQGQFDLKEPLTVNKGDKLITTCTYTNDTDKTVTFGENTGNEMCFNFALYYPQGALKCSFSQ